MSNTLSADPKAYIQFDCVSGPSLRFALQGGFTDGFENTIEDQRGAAESHPKQFTYVGGRVKDFSFVLDLAVGVGAITTSGVLLNIIERLYDMALPPEQGKQLDLVKVSIGAGGWHWFRRKAYVKDISVEFMYPWDTRFNGGPLRAKVTIVFTPHYGPAGSNADKNQLPKRNWLFSGSS